MAAARIGLSPTKIFLTAGTGYGIGKYLESPRPSSSANNEEQSSVSSLLVQTMYEIGQLLQQKLSTTVAHTSTAQQLQQLTDAVALLSKQANQPRQPHQPPTTIVVGSPSNPYNNSTTTSTLSSVLGLCTTLALATGFTWAWCKWHGVPLAELLHVTRRSFQRAIAALKTRLSRLATAIDKVRTQLSQRMSTLETKIDTTSKGLTRTIEKEGQSIRHELRQMEARQENMRGMVCGLEHQLNEIEQQTRFTSKGIYLLCSVVSSSTTPGATTGATTTSATTITNNHGQRKQLQQQQQQQQQQQHQSSGEWTIEDESSGASSDEEDEELASNENPEDQPQPRETSRQKLFTFTTAMHGDVAMKDMKESQNGHLNSREQLHAFTKEMSLLNMHGSKATRKQTVGHDETDEVVPGKASTSKSATAVSSSTHSLTLSKLMVMAMHSGVLFPAQDHAAVSKRLWFGSVVDEGRRKVQGDEAFREDGGLHDVSKGKEMVPALTPSTPPVDFTKRRRKRDLMSP